MIYGYARVSTTEQETTLQLDALRRSGVETILQEKRSSVGQRPKLMELLESLEPGDMVKVYKIDRLARSLMDLLSILDRIQKAGASFQSKQTVIPS
ncbi:MAG: recombinase family protein [Undibacterium sp.]|nr:recombinase family protein [Polaromonas sp.]MDO9192605.1 recombinase family protein [Undibacterium sp.]